MKALHCWKWSPAFFTACFAFASSGILRAADDLPLPPGVIARLGEQRFVHTDRVLFLSFIAGNQRIFSRSGDGISIWDVASGRRVFEDRGKIHRTLTNARISEMSRAVGRAARRLACGASAPCRCPAADAKRARLSPTNTSRN